MSPITGLSATALLADSHAELIDATSEEILTAGFLSGFSGAAVLDAATSVLADESEDERLETATSVLAEDKAEGSEDIAELTAAEPDSAGTPGLDAEGGSAGRDG